MSFGRQAYYEKAHTGSNGQGRTHGTVSCYQHELAQGIPTCVECRAAAREARQKHRQTRRARGLRVT